jgi:hypothetical protein
MPNSKTDPRKVVEKLYRDRYPHAQALYWAGSVAKGEGISHSDLDVVVVVEHLPNAYRETFLIEGWPVDAFIHDLETLNYFFQESRNKSGIPGVLQIASTAWLYEALSQFYFRAQGKWRASGKSITRYLENDNPNLAKQFHQAFVGVFGSSETSGLEALVMKILKPYGGLLWEGYKSEAPAECKLKIVQVG